MFKILVVEDDKALNQTVCLALSRFGYQAKGCLCAAEAYDALYAEMFDLIVSDVMMPGIDGFQFAKTVRETNEEIPILFMTARDDLASKQRGFMAGIDDYMVKPIELDELMLRIGALLRRAKIARSRKIEAGDLVLDADERSAYVGGEEIPLTMRTQDDLAVVTVADTGCGFGSEVGAHLFEKFYQGDASRATQGNGLGLALVRRVVDIVGGNIAVESEVGRGSAFTVQIRRKMDEMHQGEPVA